MKNTQVKYLLISLTILSLFTKCTTSSYYLNAFNGNHHYYHSMPLRSDSIKSASYFSGTIVWGDANYHDEVESFTAYFHRTHSFGIVQTFYGADLSVGGYNVSKQKYSRYGMIDTAHISTLNRMAGQKFFGGYGFDGGLNIAVPVGMKGAEWRIIGFETSLQEEFGSYLKFRRNIPDSFAYVNMNSSFFPTIGLTTEIILKSEMSSFGYKIAIGTSLKRQDQNKISLNGIMKDGNNPFYFVQTFSCSFQSWTIYGQLNIASYSIFLQGGFNYNLSSKRKKK